MAKKNKTITFQLDDPHEAALFADAQQEHNFSGLMKRLYAKHLEELERRKLAQLGQPIRISNQGGITYRLDAGRAVSRGDVAVVTE